MEAKQGGHSYGILRELDLYLAGIALTILIAVTFGGVVMRYFMGNPFAWEEEVQLACFVWITFLGVGVAFRTGSHVAVEILVEKMPARMARWVEIMGYAVSLAVLLFLCYYSTVLVAHMAQMGRTTNIVSIPYTAIYAVVPIGCILMIVNFSWVTWRRLREGKASEVKE